MAEYRRYAVPHHHWMSFPDNLPPGTEIYGMTRDRGSPTLQKGLDIDEFDTVKAKDGHGILIRRYQKSGRQESLPLLVYMHPGGFVTGSLETDDALCRAIAVQVDLLVLSVDYRLAPEYKFPIGLEDSHSVVEWVASQEGQKALNVDLTKGFLLGGTSAGGNFTSVIANLASQKSMFPPLTGLLFMASSFCHPDVRPVEYRDRILSVDEINDAPGLTSKSIRYFAEKYGAPPDDKRYSPLLFKDQSNIAKKAFFQICGWDPRRDEAILYSGLLERMGLGVQSNIYGGLPHGFWTTCPSLQESQDAQNDTIRGVAWLLQP